MNGSHVYWAGEFNAFYAADTYQATHQYDWICSASHDVLTPCSIRFRDVKQQVEWPVGWLCNGDGRGRCDLSRSGVE